MSEVSIELCSRRHLLRLVGAMVPVALAGCGSGPLWSGQQSCPEESTLSLTTQTDQFVAENDSAVDSMVFILENQGECPLMVSPAAWIIERKTPEGWTQVAAGQTATTQRTIASGETYNWSLSRSPHPTPSIDSTTFITENLSEGTYRFTVTGTGSDESQLSQHAEFTVEKR